MNKLEALLDAIASTNGSYRPGSPAYIARNPLMVLEFTSGKCTNKMRRFSSFLNGYQAGLYDLQIKCSGKSRAKLEELNLKNLMRAYSMPDQSVIYVVRFLRKALKDDGVKESTPLSFFVETSNGNG
jgi:hypothetical protein